MNRRRFVSLSLSALASTALANKPWKGNSPMKGKVFPCSGAGRWFPTDGEELKETVDAYLKQAKSSSAGPLAVIAPHAGYTYSGAGAGESYKVFMGKTNIKRAIVLGLSHYSRFRGVSVLSGYDAYNTPLGDIPIDTGACNALSAQKPFTFKKEAHSPEHSLENQLPFIQRALPQASIIPCIVGNLELNEFQAAGAALAKQMDASTMMAVSSDFTHYGADFGFEPFKKDVRNNLEKLDGGAIGLIEKTDFNGFYDYIEKTGATICGRNPIGVMLCALAGGAKGRLLKYYTSSDDTEDFSHAVCYASIVMEKA